MWTDGEEHAFAVLGEQRYVDRAVGGNEIVLTKTLSDAVVEDEVISWTLSQAESLSVGKGIRTAMLNWLTADGTRGVSPEVHVMFADNHIRQVM